jgi:methionine-rich copper-binding protein CopC
MVQILRHELKKQGNETVLFLYLDQSNTEFARELGSLDDNTKGDLDKSVNSYIRSKLPNLKQATVKIMVGGLLVTSFAFSPAVGGLFGGDDNRAHAAEVDVEYKGFADVKPDRESAPAIEALVKAGVIKGYPDGFHPREEISRQHAAVMFVRALKLPTDNVVDPGFKDVPKTHPYYNEIAAATAAGYFNKADNFNPNGNFTRGQSASVIVRAYDLEGDKTSPFTDLAGSGHEDAIGIMYNLGLAKGVGNNYSPNNNVTREQFAMLLHRTIEAQDTVVTPPVVAPTVNSLSGTNLKEVVVTFNSAVTGVTADNFLVKGNTVDAVAVSEDGKSVTLTLKNAISQQSDVEVTVKSNVKFESGASLPENVVQTIGVTDVTIPVMESIALTGPNTFTIKFSEPVKETSAGSGSVLINNGIFGVADKALSNDGRTLTVTTSSNTLAEGNYEVKVNGYSDYANFAAVGKTFNLDYKKDVTAPTPKLVSASQNEVVVEFDKAVTQEGGAKLTPDFFYHTYSSWKPVSVETDDNKKFTLKFSDTNPATQDFILPEGNVSVSVLKAVNEKAVVDMWGNKLADDVKLTASITADRTAPTVSNVVATNENTLELTFSEKVNVAAGNLTISDSAGKKITQTITDLKFNEDTLKATVTLSGKLAGGSYTVEVKDVTDKSLTANKITTVTQAFTVTDKTPINLTEASATLVDNTTAKEQYIYVSFPEAVATTGPNSALNKDNYLVAGSQLAAGDKVELFGNDGKRVKLTVKYRGAEPAAVVKTGDDLTIGRIADLAGNVPTALSSAVDIKNDTAPTTFTAKAVGLNKLELVFPGELKTVTADGILVDGTDVDTEEAGKSYTSVASVDNVVIKDGNTHVTVTVKASDKLASKSADELKGVSVKVENNKLETITGQKLVDVKSVTGVADGMAPELVGTNPVTVAHTADGATITLSFDEALATLPPLAAADLVLTDATGKTYVAGKDYTVNLKAGDATKLEINLTGDTAGLVGTKFTVSTASTVHYIKDAGDNSIATFAGKTTDALPAVTTAP